MALASGMLLAGIGGELFIRRWLGSLGTGLACDCIESTVVCYLESSPIG